ncbi:MAG: hypothetical protein ABGX12_06945, partial [Desulfurobacteriaceae bacterium]
AFDALALIAVTVYGRLRYREVEKTRADYGNVALRFELSVLAAAVWKGLKEAVSFTLKFTPLFILVVFLIKAGVMEWLTKALKPYLGNPGFNSLEITYITTAAISPPVAYGLINVMVKEGIPVSDILGTMAVGNAMFSLLRSWWAYLLPYYLGLYPLRIVVVLLLLQAGLPIVYNLTVGVLLVKFF